MARSVRSTASDHPSARRCVASGGSRSTQRSSTLSAACSIAAAQRCPDMCDTGRCRSQIAWMTSGLPHDECCADTASTTSATVSESVEERSAAARSTCSTRASTVQPASAASPRHRVARSVTPSPDLWPLVSAEASRSRAARSFGDGSRPSRSRNSSILTARASSMAAARLENTANRSLGMPAISAWPLTIGPHSTPKRWVSSLRKHRLVEAAEHPLMPLQVAGIERPPTAIVGLHLRRHDDVRVDLGVIGPRRRLAERRHRQTLRVRMQPSTITADPRRRPEPLQMLEHRAHGDVMGLQQAAVAGQPPPHAQRLGSRKRRIKPRHRLHHPTITSDPINELAAERCPRNGVAARQHQLQRLRLDSARQTETGGLSPAPDARHLTRRCRSGTACSTPLTSPPTKRESSSPAASDPTPDRPHGHLSAETRSGGERRMTNHGKPQPAGNKGSCEPDAGRRGRTVRPTDADPPRRTITGRRGASSSATSAGDGVIRSWRTLSRSSSRGTRRDRPTRRLGMPTAPPVSRYRRASLWAVVRPTPTTWPA